MTHHSMILQVDTCYAYHAGNNLFIEVDVVMHQETQLSDSHDIAEALQLKLECLPNVERAFVHVDYEGHHMPEHRRSSIISLDQRNQYINSIAVMQNPEVVTSRTPLLSSVS